MVRRRPYPRVARRACRDAATRRGPRAVGPGRPGRARDADRARRPRARPRGARHARRARRARAVRPAAAAARRAGRPAAGSRRPETDADPRRSPPRHRLRPSPTRSTSGSLFIGLAVFAAVGALSHQRERAFSAVADLPRARRRGAAAAIDVARRRLARPGRGRRADRAPRPRPRVDHRAVLRRAEARPAADARAPGARPRGCCCSPCRSRSGCRAARRRAARALGRRRAAARRGARADRPGARRRHRRRPAGRRGRARAELRAHRRRPGSTTASPSPFVLAGAVRCASERGSGWVGEWLAADVLYAIAVGARDRRGRRARSRPGASSACATDELLAPTFDQLPRDRHRARDLRRSPRRVGALRLPRRLRGRARLPPLRDRPRAQRARPRGRRADREAARARR